MFDEFDVDYVNMLECKNALWKRAAKEQKEASEEISLDLPP